jgi:undecaprenyl-diphosphatase
LNILQALILGIVQGITEFAPVSSSAHLVLVPWWLGWSIPSVVFDTTLHLGTLIAVLLFFYRDLWDIVTAWVVALFRPSQRTSTAMLGWWIIIGTIPAALAGVILKDFFESVFSTPAAVAVLLIVTGIILALAERFSERWRALPDLLWLDAVLIGVAQAVAILPGISRSGATISTAMWRGVNRDQAARFSFLLSVPIILGTGLKQLFDLVRHPALAHATSGTGAGAIELLVGAVAAAVVGVVVIRYLLKYLQRGTLYPFAVYCWAAGALSLIATLVWR